MRKKIEKYNQAVLLRKSGESIRAISKRLKISTSTASLWCRNIELSFEQKAILASKSANIELLRFHANKRHEDKINRNKEIFEKARLDIQKLNKDELFLAGIALYWAEGFKNLSEGRIGFCNSDPRMIKFIINWFKKVLKIPKSEFILRAEFNIEHLNRRSEIEDYWSKVTGIPKFQFNNPYLQKSKFLRDYSNRGAYYGVLRIRVRKSSALLVRLRGWIEGLSLAY